MALISSSRSFLRPILATSVALLFASASPSIHAQGPFGEDGPQVTASADHRGGEMREVRGTYFKYIADDFENGRSVTQHVIEDTAAGKRWELKFPQGVPPGLVSGQEIQVRGRPEAGKLYLEANAEGEAEVAVLEGATAEALVSGVQDTAVIMLDFPGVPSSCTAAFVDNLMFTGPAGSTVDDLYQEMSSGLVSLRGPVVGPFTLSEGDPGTCNPGGWATEADGLAAASGLNVNAYERKIYVVPSGTSCNYAGLGQVGGTSTRAWVLRCDLADVYAHELGHNFGWGHSGTTTNQYGDTSGIMGYSGQALRHANGPHKTQIGWLGNARVQDVSASGDYWVEALSLTDDEALGPQVLRLPKPDDGTYYFVSYRAAEGFDAKLNSLYRNKLAIHAHSGSGSSQTTLLTQLSDGESWTDPATNTTFSRVSTSGNAVLARVTFDGSGPGAGCSVQSPAMAVSPSSQSGLAGTALNYSVTLTNRDGTDCGSSTFNLAAAAPSGWTRSVSPSTVTLAPGASATMTLSVVSASSAPAGNHTVTVSASDGAEPNHNASASAVYQVESSCTAADPRVTLSPSSQAGDPGTTLSYQVSVTNQDSDACASSTFSLSAVRPSGWSGSVSPSSLILAPGASGVATLTVTSASTAGAGQYSVGAEAASTANSAYATAGQGVYEVNAAPPPDEDTEAPTAPTGLSADTKPNGVNVAWNTSRDNVGVAGYRLFRDGVLVADVAETLYSDKAGAGGATYYVVAYDAAGNVSSPSASVTASTRSNGGGGGDNPNKGGGSDNPNKGPKK